MWPEDDDLDDTDCGLDEVDFGALDTDEDEYGEGDEVEDDVDGWQDR